MFRIFSFYFALYFRYRDTPRSPLGMAAFGLFGKSTFRIPGSISLLSVGGRALTVMKKIFKAKPFHPVVAHEVLWDNRRSAVDIRFAHLRINGVTTVKHALTRDEIHLSFVGKLNAIFAVVVFFWPVILLAGLTGRRAQFALLFDQALEAASFIYSCRIMSCRKVFFYCPFENDANALYLLLKKEGVTVCKVPSPNLLSVHNSVLLTDELMLTSPYQADELEKFRDTLVYKKIIRGYPEQYADYAGAYVVRKEPVRGTVGFYSHGTWIRKAAGIPDTGVGDDRAEEALLVSLKQLATQGELPRVTVFLHPKEKKADRGKVEMYYDSIFGKGGYMLADHAVPGSRSFDEVDIGIGAISTILFERLFMERKTIFYPVGVRGFPVDNSRITGICASDTAQLLRLIHEMSSMETREYFATSGLDVYTRSKWMQES